MSKLKLVKFGNVDILSNYNLVMTNVSIPAPTPKRTKISIPGADGDLDLSTALSGRIVYNNREIDIEFEMLNTHNNDDYMKFLNDFHGTYQNITFSDDPDYYYHGFVTVPSWEVVKRVGKITVNIDADPFKYEQKETVITKSILRETDITIENGNMWVLPYISQTRGSVSFYFDNELYGMPSEELQTHVFQLNAGTNVKKFKGNGAIKIRFRKGFL